MFYYEYETFYKIRKCVCNENLFKLYFSHKTARFFSYEKYCDNIILNISNKRETLAFIYDRLDGIGTL